jgi:hypothetical protein
LCADWRQVEGRSQFGRLQQKAQTDDEIKEAQDKD